MTRLSASELQNFIAQDFSGDVTLLSPRGDEGSAKLLNDFRSFMKAGVVAENNSALDASVRPSVRRSFYEERLEH